MSDSRSIAAFALVIAVGWYIVRRRRAGAAQRQHDTDRHLAAFAAERGWRYLPRVPPRYGDTPFLRDGERRLGRGFELMLGPIQGHLFEHVRVDRPGGQETSYVVLQVAMILPGISRLRIRPQGSVEAGAAAEAWLNESRVVELESEEFEQRYVLEVGDECDEATVRTLFQPTFIDALVQLATGECYLGDYLEAEHATVVLAGLGTIELEDGPYVDETVRQVTPILIGLAEFVAR